MNVLTERARALLSRITPEPWEIIGGNEYLTGVGITVGAPDGIKQADAEFIAASPQLVADLLDVIDLQEADHEQAVDDWADNDACVLADSAKIADVLARVEAVVDELKAEARQKFQYAIDAPTGSPQAAGHTSAGVMLDAIATRFRAALEGK